MQHLLAGGLPPGEEGEDGPEGAAVIGLAGKMFLGHAADGGGIEDAGRFDMGGLGEVEGPALEILLQPGRHGHGEAGFFALEDGFRQIPSQGFPQDQLGLAAAQFVVRAQGEGVGDQIDVEERDADFQGVGHGGAVDFHEDTFLKVKFGAEVEQSFQAPGEAAALGESGDVLERIGAVKLVADFGGEQVLAFRVSAGPHPEEETDFRRKTEAFDELGQKERKTFVVMGHGQALDEMIDGIADRDREEGEDRKSTRLNSSHSAKSRMPSSA